MSLRESVYDILVSELSAQSNYIDIKDILRSGLYEWTKFNLSEVTP